MARSTSAVAVDGRGHAIRFAWSGKDAIVQVAFVEEETGQPMSDDQDMREDMLVWDDDGKDLRDNTWKRAVYDYAVARGYYFSETPKRFPRRCACSCGEITKGGRFLPGHDAKVPSTRNPVAEIRASGLRAWWNGIDEDGYGCWTIATLGQSVETVARLRVLEAKREKREDWTGRTKAGYRWGYTTRIEMTVVLGYKAEVVLDDPIHCARATRSSIKDAMQLVSLQAFSYQVRHQLETAARAAGIAEHRIIDCYDSRKARHELNLYRLLNRK